MTPISCISQPSARGVKQPSAHTVAAAGFLVLYCCLLMYSTPECGQSWFIRGSGLRAAISPFRSALWLPDNIQLSLMCHQGPMVRLSALLLRCSAHLDEYTLAQRHTCPHSHTWWQLCCQTHKNPQMKYIIGYCSYVMWSAIIVYAWNILNY